MKTLIVSICILFYVAYLHAQTNYYTTTKTFNESGYTYQCDIPPYNLVTLYNKSNKWIYVHSIYKDTGKNFVQDEAGDGIYGKCGKNRENVCKMHEECIRRCKSGRNNFK